MRDFITELSEKFAPIVKLDAKVIFAFLEKDIAENPPTDTELKELRTSKDKWIAMAVSMLEDEAQGVKSEFIAALDDGLW